MSLFWMSVVAVHVCHQKLALIGLGLVIVIAPWLVPGLTPPTM